MDSCWWQRAAPLMVLDLFSASFSVSELCTWASVGASGQYCQGHTLHTSSQRSLITIITSPSYFFDRQNWLHNWFPNLTATATPRWIWIWIPGAGFRAGFRTGESEEIEPVQSEPPAVASPARAGAQRETNVTTHRLTTAAAAVGHNRGRHINSDSHTRRWTNRQTAIYRKGKFTSMLASTSSRAVPSTSRHPTTGHLRAGVGLHTVIGRCASVVYVLSCSCSCSCQPRKLPRDLPPTNQPFPQMQDGQRVAPPPLPRFRQQRKRTSTSHYPGG